MGEKEKKEDGNGKDLSANIQSALSSIKDPALREHFKDFLESLPHDSVEQDAVGIAKELHNKLAANAKLSEQMWLPVVPMPTDLCRVSPFFPINRRNLKERKFLKDMIISKSSWGQIQFTGPMLSIYDEDVLMAILAILNRVNRRKVTESEQGTTYTYSGPISPIAKLLGYKSPGSREFKHILESLSLMAVAGVKLVINQDKKKNKVKEWFMSSILVAARWDEVEKKLTVTLNPYFYEIYVKNSFTLLDLEKRARLSAPVAKALYRFVMSHKDDVWQGHFLTLSASLNLDLEQPAFRLRELVKKACDSLIRQGTLTKDSKLVTQDIIRIVRSPAAKERFARKLSPVKSRK